MLSAHTASPEAPYVDGAVRCDGYERRRPDTTNLYKVIAEYWPAFRNRAEEQGGLPRFVEKEFEEYLSCGILNPHFSPDHLLRTPIQPYLQGFLVSGFST